MMSSNNIFILGEPVAVLHGANAPLLQKMIEKEKQSRNQYCLSWKPIVEKNNESKSKKVDKMNGPEIIRLNRAVKKRTKTRKEFKAFVAAVRAELLMKTSEVDFYD